MKSLALALLLAPGTVVAQDPVSPPRLTQDEEVAMARSAAPPEVSDPATVYVLRGDQYEVAVEGTGGTACMVARSYPLSLEPICYDPEGARTILRIEQARVEMRLAGLPPSDVDEHINRMIAGGRLPLPGRAAMAYMMSPRQVLYADAHTRVGAWRPHYHVFVPYMSARNFGGASDETVPGVGSVSDPGTATASLVIVAERFTTGDGGAEGR